VQFGSVRVLKFVFRTCGKSDSGWTIISPKSQFWFTTQPIEEPEKPEHLRKLIDWIGWDRLLFATDYPHWDSDDPRYAFKCHLSDDERRAVFAGNAKSVYGL
jgi:predicted TIM-barrel fold metal-dependent hydrolase